VVVIITVISVTTAVIVATHVAITIAVIVVTHVAITIAGIAVTAGAGRIDLRADKSEIGLAVLNGVVLRP